MSFQNNLKHSHWDKKKFSQLSISGRRSYFSVRVGLFLATKVKVKVGVQGAIECGDFEEWFNYRLSRAAPDTCAEFLGSFISDKTNSIFTKGEKWLVWKFEVNVVSKF
ncbi:putative non-specific serine/threonine protein kinase [Helianthus annuus]|nr:putative non-specific serine/threonine protein kinase [Helianthus annuus]KAJ0842793.1 putative non-specific serine/threonine protein kinase [Helianthus annuus]